MIGVLTIITSEYGAPPKISDELIRKIALGDTDALRALYEDIAANVYGFALSILRNTHDADDVLQEAFLKIYDAAPDYKPSGKPMAWVLTITRNLSLSKLRERKRETAFDEGYSEQIDFSRITRTDDRFIVEQLFLELSEAEKQIVMLHAVSGLKHREIAELLDLPLSSVLSKYHRALAKLKAAAEKEMLL